jgi:transcription initiation factor TFIID TATA-box-binding protein
MNELKIENIIFSAIIAEKIDIQYLSQLFVNSKYNIDEFSGLVLNFNDPKCAIFLSPKGKLTCTGIKKIDDIEIVMNRIINKIDEFNIKIFDDIHVDIDNIIASSILDQNLNLDYIKDQIKFGNIVDINNDFPGLIYYVPDFKINIIIFDSGKIVFTGGKEIEDIKKTLRILKEKLVNI